MKHEKAPTAPRFQGVFTFSYMLMFRKTAVFRHFGQFRPFQVAEPGRTRQKAHLQAKTFHMSIFPDLYDHPLQRNNLEKLMFRKTADFGHFGQFRPFPVAEPVKRHIYRPRPFILAYLISRSLRPFVTKIQPGKESMTDRRTDGRTDRRTDGRTPRIYRPPTFGVGA